MPIKKGEKIRSYHFVKRKKVKLSRLVSSLFSLSSLYQLMQKCQQTFKLASHHLFTIKCHQETNNAEKSFDLLVITGMRGKTLIPISVQL